MAAAAVAFIFFLMSVARILKTSPRTDFSPVVLAGGAIYVTGLMIMSCLTIALVDASHHGMAGAAQTLNVLASDAWVPVVVGISVLALGTGVSALKGRTLPAWLAWVSVTLGILALAGPAGGIAFMLIPLWAVVTGIYVFRSDSVTPTHSEPSDRMAARV